jgi:enterobactin synthetase component D
MTASSVSAFLLDADAPSVRGAALTQACRFALAGYDDALFARLDIVFPPALARALPKRRAEYLAGRHAAGAALQRLGSPVLQVGSGADGAPCWPAGVVGSITHSGDLAACSVAAASVLRALGIDAEHFPSPAVAGEVAPTIVGDVEQRLLRALPLPLAQGLTLAFSAKESLYKALYPQVGRFFDFSAAELIAVDLERQAFVLRLAEDWARAWPAGSRIEGGFEPIAGGLMTRIEIPAGPATTGASGSP